jgi:hypothetical protein
MFQLPKDKKTLTGLVSTKSIKKVVTGVMLTAGLILGGVATPTDSCASISDPQNGTSITQDLRLGALVLTSPAAGLTRTAYHTSHVSHASHESHVSHYSSRY